MGSTLDSAIHFIDAVTRRSTNRYPLGTRPLVHTPVPVELKQVGLRECDRGDSDRKGAQRC
jgi:hypothetical protein